MQCRNFHAYWKFCIVIYVSVKVSHCSECNFDVDFCNWGHDGFGDFNWSRQNGQTPSGSTGPNKDHTSGVGHYIYIETSSPQEYGDKARLISSMQELGAFCLIFWYNMYGQSIGSLDVYMTTVIESNILLFSRNRSMESNIWEKAVVSNFSNADFQIVFEGTVGGDAKGDIAIDDVKLTSEYCSAGCNFEEGLCDWKQDQRDSFDWTRQSGLTDTPCTGPLSDHTVSINGFYIYIETSHPRVFGDNARLISPQQGAGMYCWIFWYNMFGKHINKLSVYLKTEFCPEILIFSKKDGTNSMDWMKAEISLQSASNFEIIIEGVCGSGVEGDIAVDDITIRDGECKTDSALTVDILQYCQTKVTQLQSSKSHNSLTNALTRKMNVTTTLVSKSTTVFYSSVSSIEEKNKNSTTVVPLTSNIFTNSDTSVPSSMSQNLDTTNIPTNLSTTSNTGTRTTPSFISKETFSTTMLSSYKLTTGSKSSLKAIKTTSTNSRLGTKRTKTVTSVTSVSSGLSTAKRTSFSQDFTSMKPMSDISETQEQTTPTHTTHFDKMSITYTSPTVSDTGRDKKVYILIIIIVVVAGTVVSVCYILRQKMRSKMAFDERSITRGQNGNLFFTLDDENFSECDVDRNQAQAEQRSSRANDYTEVYFENIVFQDARNNSVSQNIHEEEEIHESKHIYTHLGKQKGHFVNKNYSHIIHSFMYAKNDSLDQIDSSLTQEGGTSTDNEQNTLLQFGRDGIDANKKLQKSQLDLDSEKHDKEEIEVDIVNHYNTLKSGGSSKTARVKDTYSHLNYVKSSRLDTDGSYPYAKIIKQAAVNVSNDGEDSNCINLTDAGTHNDPSVSFKPFELQGDNDEIDKHEYFILEKI